MKCNQGALPDLKPMLIVLPSDPPRASSRDVSKMGSDAAPAGGDGRTPLPGGPDNPPGGHRTPLRGARWTGTGPIASSQEARIRDLYHWLRPEMRVAMERREAPAFSKENAARRIRTRHLALHPLDFSRGKWKAPAAAGSGLVFNAGYRASPTSGWPTRDRQKHGRIFMSSLRSASHIGLNRPA
jgi:hypothetical protein